MRSYHKPTGQILHSAPPALKQEIKPPVRAVGGEWPMQQGRWRPVKERRGALWATEWVQRGGGGLHGGITSWENFVFEEGGEISPWRKLGLSAV